MNHDEHDWACASCGTTEPADPGGDGPDGNGGSLDLPPLSFSYDDCNGMVCRDCQLVAGTGFPRIDGGPGRAAA